MAAPTIVGVGTGAFGSAVTVTPTYPVGWQPGDDIWIVTAHKGGFAAPLTVAGFDEVIEQGSSNGCMQVHHRTAQAGDDTTPSVTGATQSVSAHCIATRGGNFSSIVTASSGTPGVIPAIDPVDLENLILIFIGSLNNTATSAWSYAGGTPSEHFDQGTADGTNSQVAGASIVVANGNAISAGSYTNTNGVAMVVALPALSTPTVETDNFFSFI